MAVAESRSSLESQRGLFFGTAALFFFVLLLGGGGAPAPLAQALLEIASLFWLLYLLWAHLFVRPIPREALIPALFLLAMLLLLAFHLLPLPYAVWSGLPGRELAAEAVAAAGHGQPWMPLSLVPEGTRLAGLQLLPAMAILFGTYSLMPAERLLLVRIPIAVALISALVAVLQFLNPGNESFYLFPRSIFTSASGLFANRNFQASLLLIAILLCAHQAKARRIEGSEIRPGGFAPAHAWLLPIPLFALMVLATLSRMGALLLVPVLLAATIITFSARVRRAAWAGAAALSVAAGALFFLAPSFVRPIVERFQGHEGRLDTLADLAHAAGRYFPFGSGLGTFDPVFRASESLDQVQSTYLNHAHNDYFEVLIEAGLPGVALVVLFLVLFLHRAWLAAFSGRRTPYALLQRVAILGIGLLLVHSIVDYPLRTITLQSVFAFFCAVLFSDAGAGRRSRGGSQ